MITWFRTLAKSWIAKVLFVLLIVSFGAWGIQDSIQSAFRETAVVRMNGAEIEVPQAQMAARRELSRLQRQLGPSFEPTPAIREAVASQAVEGLITESAQRIEARHMGVATPDQQVRDYVLSIPSFQMGGQFNRLILEQFLRQNDMTEPMFLQLVRDDLQRMQLVGAVRAGAAGPESGVRALVGWERERRVAQVAELPLVEAPEPEPPTEAQLSRFHDNNPQIFSTPEMREVSLAVLSAESLADQVDITDAELQAAFEARKAQFETAERREVEQVLAATEESARGLAATWRQGGDLAALTAAATAAGGTAVALGTVTRDDLPVPALADAVFGLPQGGVSDPVQSPFGWHVFRVAAIAPGTEAAFDDVKDRLRHDVALEKAGDLAFDRANRVEDAIAGGASLEEAARRYGMALATVTLDAQGNDAGGVRVDLPVPDDGRAETLRLIFAAEPGRAPRLQELRQADAFVAVDLRRVVAPALKPLASIEGEVRHAWMTDARKRYQEERAAALMAAVRGGQTLEQATTAASIPSERLGPFGRRPEPAQPGTTTVPAELLPGLFGIKVGEVTMAPTANGFAVAQLLEIVRPDDAEMTELLATARRTVQQQAAEDLEAQYQAALRARAAPRVSPTLMQQVVP